MDPTLAVVAPDDESSALCVVRWAADDGLDGEAGPLRSTLLADSRRPEREWKLSAAVLGGLRSDEKRRTGCRENGRYIDGRVSLNVELRGRPNHGPQVRCFFGRFHGVGNQYSASSRASERFNDRMFDSAIGTRYCGRDYTDPREAAFDRKMKDGNTSKKQNLSIYTSICNHGISQQNKIAPQPARFRQAKA
ncbi:hypothetical protein [Burkholderia pyrrocinia]